MMKEERVTFKVFFRIVPVFLLAFLFFGSRLSLYSAENKLPLSLSFSLGYFHPNEESFKELYGGNTFQLNFNVSYVLLKNVSVFSGLRYISCKGETKIVGTEIQEEKYRLKFTMYSIPIGLICSFSMKNMHPFLGGGVSYNIYSEKWGQLDISFEGKKAGFFLSVELNTRSIEGFLFWEAYNTARFQLGRERNLMKMLTSEALSFPSGSPSI